MFIRIYAKQPKRTPSFFTCPSFHRFGGDSSLFSVKAVLLSRRSCIENNISSM
ncbi:hypothetical protein BDZ94DRAFT_1263661 [Collybia nuda]|uniref:Uncharacterized protein n=1 Tax=Collybia nuda TaxID=64659 RepID=A0A9P5Y336_9AGAR|nr:hypothetical protein BDZ94DRAFT_1263661 [Collybia nuda]